MRDINFRGKRTDNGEWVYGYVCCYGWTGEEKTYIVPNYASALYSIEVNPETVGQCIDLKDRNGINIFEGDIVKRVCFGKMSIYQIVYDNDLTSFIGQAGVRFTTFDYGSTEFEVIGNIYDNKLEGFNNGTC